MKKLSDVHKFTNLKKYDGLVGRFPLHSENRYFGIEIEMENISKTINFPGSFRYHKDHSLKVMGAEYVTVPIQSKFLEIELSRLFLNHPERLFSSRCSVHYHMNVRDITVEHLRKLILIYLLCERQIYKHSGDRWDNIFCVPARYHLRLLKEICLWQEWHDSFLWGKYTGINFLPMNTLGTIEFRMSKGTSSLENILSMVNIFSCLKTAAKSVDMKELQEAIKSHNPKAWLQRNVFTSFWDLSSYPESDFVEGNMFAEILLEAIKED